MRSGAHGDGFVHRIADQAIRDGFQSFFKQISDGQLGFDVAGTDVTVELHRDRAAIAILQEVETTRSGIVSARVKCPK